MPLARRQLGHQRAVRASKFIPTGMVPFDFSLSDVHFCYFHWMSKNWEQSCRFFTPLAIESSRWRKESRQKSVPSISIASNEYCCCHFLPPQLLLFQYFIDIVVRFFGINIEAKL